MTRVEVAYLCQRWSWGSALPFRRRIQVLARVPLPCLPPVRGKARRWSERMSHFHFKIRCTGQTSRPVILFGISLVMPGPLHQVHAAVRLCYTAGVTGHSVCGRGGGRWVCGPAGLCLASTALRSGYPVNSIPFTMSWVSNSRGPQTQATPGEMLESPARKQSLCVNSSRRGAPSLPRAGPTCRHFAHISLILRKSP